MKFLLISTIIGLLVSCSSREDKSGESEAVGDSGFQFKIRVEERMGDDGKKIPITALEVDNSMNVIKVRLKGMGISAMDVSREGDRGILLKVSGIEEKDLPLIKTMLEKVSLLGLHLVHPESDKILPAGKSLAQGVFDGDEIVPGYIALTQKGKMAGGDDFEKVILINRKMALSGWDISTASVSLESQDSVDVTLSDDGESKMIAFTSSMHAALDRIAVVIDGEVLSAPVVQQVPLGRYFRISGLDRPGEAKALALTLMHPLENALIVEDMTAFTSRTQHNTHLMR